MTDLPKLDSQQKLAAALKYHTSAHLSEAKRLYLEVLEEDGQNPTALHHLGVIALQQGDNDTAVDFISRAIASKPNFAEAYNNKGTALRGLGRVDEAVQSYQKALSVHPGFADAHFNLGLAHLDLGCLEDAVLNLRQAVSCKPEFELAHFKLAQTLGRLGKTEEAIASYKQVLALNASHAEAFFLVGALYQNSGQFEAAIHSYQAGLEIQPDTPAILCNLGMMYQEFEKNVEAHECYKKSVQLKPDMFEARYNFGNLYHSQKKLDEAFVELSAALEIEPESVPAHNNLGVVLKDQERFEEALVHFHKALKHDPGYVAAYDNICEIQEKTNDTEGLRGTVKEALLHCQSDPRLALRQAQLLKRDRDYVNARNILEGHGEIDGNIAFNAARYQALGDLCDRLDDTDAAFQYFEKCNNERKKELAQSTYRAENYLAGISLLRNSYTSEWVSSWQDHKHEGERADPVFLVGFPRSGTTLLDTILRSHKSVRVVEEGPATKYMETAAKNALPSYPDGLNVIRDEQVAEIKNAYFAGLDDCDIDLGASAIIVDKMPLNLIDAGLIHRIFPQARFLFALRHPCDCVLSCFMQDFALNDAMTNFLTLEGSAHLYDDVMSLWQQYRSLLPLRVHTVRYETLIEDLEGTVKPVLDFLELEWDEGIRNYAETARARKLIGTPSYNQVTQPLYTRARGRWERYLEKMGPVMPRLEPWISQFGYEF